jgi:hypothetical protein
MTAPTMARPLDHGGGMVGGKQLLNFPEISMWGRSPWGGWGANPMPTRFQALWDETEGKVVGGMPYSEGIYEDMNMVVAQQHYWDSAANANATLREYVGFEFSQKPQDIADIMQASPRAGDTCHCTRSSAAIACHSLGIHTWILLPALSFSVKMTVSPCAIAGHRAA